ncbi:MAG: lipoyl(octanoyl) transferase, partial [Gillisia sp.]|nr:lipoyl(octanoyl) transferase [Gillisia sp.]
MNKNIQLQHLGLRDYKETWNYQEQLFNSILDLKIRNRREDLEIETPNYLLLLEHPHV